MTHDIIEHPPRPTFPATDFASAGDPPPPLPSRWNETDKHNSLELFANGLEAKLSNPPRRSGEEAGCVRADRPIPRQTGIYYFEVEILGSTRGAPTGRFVHDFNFWHPNVEALIAHVRDLSYLLICLCFYSAIGIGFQASTAALTRMPGWEPSSWAYHGDDGQIYASRDQGKPYAAKYGKGDTIGCGINFRLRTAFFTRNGAVLRKYTLSESTVGRTLLT
jgi:hypothetical protein